MILRDSGGGRERVEIERVGVVPVGQIPSAPKVHEKGFRHAEPHPMRLWPRPVDNDGLLATDTEGVPSARTAYAPGPVR